MLPNISVEKEQLFSRLIKELDFFKCTAAVLPTVKLNFYTNYPPFYFGGSKMTMATRQEVLGLYRRIFRLARKWQAASGQMEDTIKEKQYILNEARMLFQKNKNVSRPRWRLQGGEQFLWRLFISLLSYS